ncbi:hypothetical protein T492DRAFT_456729 [Pavlovales sp. CCMP2436]|nr:hypothetical protein T492DRAFT_456729 [Pavlovales sp. CCMP2436]
MRTVIVGVAASIVLQVIGFLTCALVFDCVMVLAVIAICTRLNILQRSAYHFKSEKVEHDLEQRATEVKKDTRGRLLRVVMHDLRSPLLSIANSAAVLDDLFKKKPATRLDDQTVNKCHNVIATCSTLMQNLLADMLEFERIDSGKVVLVPAKLHASQMLQAAAETFGGLAASRGVTLRVEPLPPALDASVFVGDARRLQQCLNNGVSSAINSTKAGDTVTIRAHQEDAPNAESATQPSQVAATTDQAPSLNKSSLVFEVADSGAGFSPSELDLSNMGDSHMRLDSAGRGRGATLRLELNLPAGSSSPSPEKRRKGARSPLVDNWVKEAAPCALGARRSTDNQYPPSFRMLHVEDDSLVRKSLELRVLRKLKVPFDIAENGAEAVRLILEEKVRYDFVLMDNQMPFMTGELATRALRAGNFEGMIVGMTGDPLGCVERDDFEASGLNECVTKDTPGISRIAQLISSFSLDKEE